MSAAVVIGILRVNFCFPTCAAFFFLSFTIFKRGVNKQALLDTTRKIMTVLWVLKSNVSKLHICFKLYVIEKIDTDRHTNIWIDINSEVKVAVILPKNIFSSSKLFHAHVQYVFNESAKYHNFSTNSSSEVDFTMHALSQLYLSAYKTH